jgi:uncharacterized membrane protein
VGPHSFCGEPFTADVEEVPMTHQEASAVVSLPVAEVETRLRQVEQWPNFLIGVDGVTTSSFERYAFTVRSGRHTRVVPVAVLARPREHRIAWRALAGPAFDGEFRLHALDDGRTRVVLSLTAEPAGFLAGLGEMVGSSTSMSTAMLDLQRLEAFLAGTGAPATGEPAG